MTTREFLLSAWRIHPVALAAAGILALLFVLHWRKSKNRTAANVWSLAAAILLFLLVFGSPLDALADGYLFSAHMLQHLLLQLVLPPFLIWAWQTGRSSNHTSSADVRKGTSSVFVRPLLGWVGGVGGMWLWHVPALCDAATSNGAVRVVQVISLLTLGTLFWLPILSARSQWRLPPLAGVLYLFSACVGCTLLGILITFAPISVCPVYAHPTGDPGILSLIRNDWHMDSALDQQIGGLLMWVPACFIYLSGITGLLARWYGESTESVGAAQGREHPRTA